MDSFKIDSAALRSEAGAVDLCVSAEHIRRYDIDPQTCRTRGKDRGIMDGTKECV